MELYLPPLRSNRNRPNGRFLKGCIPHNKGKKWADYMDMGKAKGVLDNLKKYRQAGNPKMYGWNKRKVIGIKDRKIVAVFESAEEAARKLSISASAIRNCCLGRSRRSLGVSWYYEDSDEWLSSVDY
jgi:hypothetical protein